MMLIINQHEICAYDLLCTGQCIYSLSDLVDATVRKDEYRRDED